MRKWIEFARGEAGTNHLGGLLSIILFRAIPFGEPVVCVEENVAGVTPAQQFVDGKSRTFSGDVPERDVDPADGA